VQWVIADAARKNAQFGRTIAFIHTVMLAKKVWQNQPIPDTLSP
jgi:hypothetical protein